MRPLRTRLQEARGRLGLPWEVLERDDLLSWVLAEIRVYAERGWSRLRARDYYDLWRLLMTFRDRMDLADFPSFFREKCAIRSVVFSGPGDFFQDRMLAYVEKTWDHWLGPLTPGLPAYQALIDELRPQVASLFPAGL